MQTFSIKITGSGSLSQIIDALNTVKDSIHESFNDIQSRGSMELEDAILFTEITEEIE